MEVLRADPIDSELLTQLTLRSKNHWGYGQKQIDQWIDELTVSQNLIKINPVYKCIIEHLTAGYYAYNYSGSQEIKLTHLFIDPAFIGRGIGKKLLRDFLSRIEHSDADKVVLDADPNAEGFYRKYGFKVIGQLPSSIEGRTLPIMELKLKMEQTS